MEKILKVVGAIIENDNREILCALRSPEMSSSNVWEFPGGKIEIRCRLISGIPAAKEHSKIIWLRRENLLSLVWAPADVPAVRKLIDENN